MQQLTTSGGAMAVNSAGQVAITGSQGSVVTDGRRTTSLGDLNPVDINDRGWVAGTVPVGDDTHAAVWHRGRMTDLGTLGGDDSTAFAINERGHVLGTSEAADGSAHLVVWAGGRTIDLGVPASAALASTNSDINDRDQVVGLVQGADGQPRGMVWQIRGA